MESSVTLLSLCKFNLYSFCAHTRLQEYNLVVALSHCKIFTLSISLWLYTYLNKCFCVRIVYLFIFKFNLILFFNFTILYWFCHISKWICHRYTCVPHPEPSPSSLPIPSLWVIPVHQPQASSIVDRTWTFTESLQRWHRVFVYWTASFSNY